MLRVMKRDVIINTLQVIRARPSRRDDIGVIAPDRDNTQQQIPSTVRTK